MLLCRIISGEPQDENSSVVNSVKMLTLGRSLKVSFAILAFFCSQEMVAKTDNQCLINSELFQPLFLGLLT